MYRLNPITVIRYHLYLLQLEEFNLRRYWKVIFHFKGLPSKKPRKPIVWTNKIILIEGIALIMQFIDSFGFSYLVNNSFLLAIIFFIILSYIHFVYLTIAVTLLSPLDFFLKTAIIWRAKEKLRQFPHLKIIGIAGSYGKTTMKELVTAVTKEKYHVLATPGTINTPLGIAQLILKHLTPQTQILIVEMGEYTKGDIASICQLVPPDMALITGINEAHLERMGNLQNTTAAIFELAEHSKENAMVLLNTDNEQIMKHYQEFTAAEKVLFFGHEQLAKTGFNVRKLKYLESAGGISFELTQHAKSLGEFKTKLLGSYVIGDIIASIIIANQLDIPLSLIKQALSHLEPISHRLQPIHNKVTDVLVIDDSYNGNPDGVKEAIRVLSEFKKRRKIYLTPGLVESGRKAKEIHYNIGKQLATVANKVVLVKNSVTPYIEEGLMEHGFHKDDIVWFQSAEEAHNSLTTFIKKGDVILFQNDWPDNYF